MRSRAATSFAVVAVIAATVLTGCTEEQQGTPVSPGWSAAPIFAGLRTVSATFETTYRIELVDPVVLNRVAMINRADAPTTAATVGARPGAEALWVREVIDSSTCAEAMGDDPGRDTPGVRTGPPSLMLSVFYGDNGADAALALCEGPADPAAFADPAKRADDVVGRTLGGIDGGESSGLWAGQRPDSAMTYVVGTEVPAAAAEAWIAGTVIDGSLAEHPGVQAVLKHAPAAAMLTMGTSLLTNATGESEKWNALLLQAMSSSGHNALPVPEFAGYGWTAGPRSVGTATFVTVYGSTQEAQSASEILRAAWPIMGNSAFTGAVTTTDGSTVVTVIEDVRPDEFTVSDRTVLIYPGFQKDN